MAPRRSVASWEARSPKTRARWNAAAGGRWKDDPNGPGRSRYLSGAQLTPAQRGHVTTPRPATPQQALRSAGSTKISTRSKANEALGSMRRRGWSLNRAAREAHTTPDAILRQAGPALEQTPGGRWVAKPTDDLVRVMTVVSGGEVYRQVAITDSEAASNISKYLRALDDVLKEKPGAEERLAEFAGVVVEGELPDGTPVEFELETDIDVISDLARTGQLDDLPRQS